MARREWLLVLLCVVGCGRQNPPIALGDALAADTTEGGADGGDSKLRLGWMDDLLDSDIHLKVGEDLSRLPVFVHGSVGIVVDDADAFEKVELSISSDSWSSTGAPLATLTPPHRRFLLGTSSLHDGNWYVMVHGYQNGKRTQSVGVLRLYSDNTRPTVAKHGPSLDLPAPTSSRLGSETFQFDEEVTLADPKVVKVEDEQGTPIQYVARGNRLGLTLYPQRMPRPGAQLHVDLGRSVQDRSGNWNGWPRDFTILTRRCDPPAAGWVNDDCALEQLPLGGQATGWAHGVDSSGTPWLLQTRYHDDSGLRTPVETRVFSVAGTWSDEGTIPGIAARAIVFDGQTPLVLGERDNVSVIFARHDDGHWDELPNPCAGACPAWHRAHLLVVPGVGPVSEVDGRFFRWTGAAWSPIASVPIEPGRWISEVSASATPDGGIVAAWVAEGNEQPPMLWVAAWNGGSFELLGQPRPSWSHLPQVVADAGAVFLHWEDDSGALRIQRWGGSAGWLEVQKPTFAPELGAAQSGIAIAGSGELVLWWLEPSVESRLWVMQQHGGSWEPLADPAPTPSRAWAAPAIAANRIRGLQILDGSYGDLSWYHVAFR